MFVEGHIIDFLDADQLRTGYVRKQERERLQVIDPRGRNLSVHSDRIVVVHLRIGESDFPSTARDIAERVAARQSDVDIELLWNSLGGVQREYSCSELAELYFAENNAECSAALFRLLSEDALYFRRKGVNFLPKTAEQIDSERLRRSRELERERRRTETLHALERVVRDPKAEITADLQPLLDRIHEWLRHKTGDESATLLEDLVGEGEARDAAYTLLVRAGRIDPSRDRFLAMAGIEEHFPQAVLDAANTLSPPLHSTERVDYRGLPTITIDDPDTREVDDALTCQQTETGFTVGIHIADVSAAVLKGDLLDMEAARRGSTIYLPSTTVCMLPVHLSTNLASLVQDKDRAAFSVEVQFDRDLQLTASRVVSSTIQVNRRLSYDEADKLVEDGDSLLAPLHRIATRLQEQRAAKGAITFRRPEVKIDVVDGQILLHKIDPNAPSRILVSEMMILANGLAADFAAVKRIPIIFRTQEAREGAPLGGATTAGAVAFDKLRRTFKKSRLSLTPGPHSGLGLSAYTQMSSPIRRYADMVTQRQLSAALHNRALPHSQEELLLIIAAVEAAEGELRSIEDRSETFWLLEYLSRQSKQPALKAIVLDTKGSIELEDYYLRSKLSGPVAEAPGSVLSVTIESIDPARGDVRFRRA